MQEAINSIDGYFENLYPFIHIWFNYSKIEKEFLYNEINNQKTQNNKEKYNEAHENFRIGLKQLRKGINLLKIINVKDAIVLIDKHSLIVREYNNQIVTNKKTFMKTKEFETFLQDLETMKNSFYFEINKYFEEIS